MTYNRAEAVDRQLLDTLRACPPGPAVDREAALAAPVRPGSTLTGARLLELLDSQLLCRQLDLVAREMKAAGTSFYTIGSAGHEGNAVVGALTRATDPAFLHYRSGALFLERSRQRRDGGDPVREVVAGLAAALEDPVCQGRHKVWGSRALWVPPQTSTIASHLPKAVGAALGIERGHRLGLDMPVPADAIAVCSFGDASLNHSTAQGAINAAGWMAHQRLPLPLLLVCEDNGLGISVATPPGWVEASMRGRPGFAYVAADGLDLVAAWDGAARAVELCRRERRPVFLHLRTVRLLGHAGSDIEQEYRSLAEIEATERLDPVLATARAVVALGLLGPDEVLARYEAARARVRQAGAAMAGARRLTSAREVMAPLAPYHPERVQAEAARPPAREVPGKAAIGRQRHLASQLNRALHEALAKYPEALLFGEDVARKGGVYHVTAGLWKEFGPARVFNTLLDEQAILGLAIGTAHLGLLPIPEIQYLAYVHNAEDQLRGEACSLQFFSDGQFQNPMVVRIAGFAYQKGFGGHFHNDDSVAVLRDMPGLVIAAPARGDDAVRMLRTCLALARSCGRVVAFLEPIALYMTKDLHEENDGLWLSDFPGPGEAVPLGEARVYHADAPDLTIVSYANGLWLSLRAARLLEREHGVRARVVDLRWLAPLDLERVTAEARATGRLLVVDECRRAGGLGEAVVAGVVERAGGAVETALLAAEDTYVPLGPAMNLVLPDEPRIVTAALALMRRRAGELAAT